MSLQDVAEQVRRNLKKDELFKGAFIAYCMLSPFWYFIIGPLARVLMKPYWITITDKRLYFTRLNIFQKPLVTDDFEYADIINTVIEGKMFARTIMFILNGKELKFSVPFRKNSQKNILSSKMLEFLEGKLK